MSSDTGTVRHPLLLAPEDVSGVCPQALRAEGWHLSTARDLRAAAQAIAQHPLTVGLAFLDPHDERPDKALEEFILNHPDVEWIALLAPGPTPPHHHGLLRLSQPPVPAPADTVPALPPPSPEAPPVDAPLVALPVPA